MTNFKDFDLDLNKIKVNKINLEADGTTGAVCETLTKTYLTMCNVTCDGDKCIWPVTRNCSASDMTACYAGGDNKLRC
ncbi:hypothetical protein PEPTYR26121_00799 [Peptoniphilus tyrrelliae]|nr:hypothetical protein PEPTYR26121_00799 [Peptoniphilus tyrrelliae]